MNQTKQNFIAFAVETGVLQFGQFTLKSGRISPYFFNAGLFNSGASMLTLSRFYAQTIHQSGKQFDVLFGPAYKGITLACSTAMALSELQQGDIPYAYNRKEKKSHGEGGVIVGAPLTGKVAIIDDVITAGTAIRESFDLIKAAKAEASAVFLMLDRQERGQQGDTILAYSAVQQVQQDYGIDVLSIAGMNDLIEFVETREPYQQHLQAMQTYRDQYGI